MKTENTLRTVRNSLLCFFMALGAGFLVACGGGGGSVSGDSGTFHASDWVVGLDYTYLDNGETGKTGEKGVFPLRDDQLVAFSIGQVTLGTLSSVPKRSDDSRNDDFITPTRIGGDRDRAINVERLLIALDSDGDSTNGTITLNAQSAMDAMTVWSTVMAMTDATTVTVAVSDGDPVKYPVPSSMRASMLLANTNNCAFSGAFEGTWTDSDGFTGETALVLLAFNSDSLDAVNNPVTVRGAGVSLSQVIASRNNGKALYVNMWKEGGGSQSNVGDFGSDSGELAIDLSSFPVSIEISVAIGTITLMVESHNRMTYTSAQEMGVYRRVVNGDIRDADYRMVGFYSDQKNDDTPAEAEIGIFAFSANKGGGRVRPYVGWFSSDGTGVYSNIGEGGLSDYLDYTGTPDADGGGVMMFTEEGDDEVSFTVNRFTDNGGFGTYTYSDDTDSDDVEALVGGWCAL